MKPSPSFKKSSGRTQALHNGDHMSQAEFHRRYEEYPGDEKFELIGGIVYMASPVKNPHGTFHFELNTAMGLYKAFTPGVEGGNNQTAILGEEAEPQPDLLLRLLPECGGQSFVGKDQYLVGAPEMVLEVAHSSRAIDLNKKNRDYLAAGVQEYIVYCIEEEEIFWFHFPSKRKLKADKQGVWKSRIFPGLWINGPALVAEDTAKLIVTVQEGLATSEHAAFVKRLEAVRRKKA